VRLKTNKQTPDLFGFGRPQADLFAEERARNVKTVSANPDGVRARLHKMLMEAKEAGSLSPWDERTTRLYRIIFPQMTKWLPEAEAEQLCSEFQNELERLKISA
jgi:hypothetical protein